MNNVTFIAVLVAALAVCCREAQAQTEPFKVSGEGVVAFIPLSPGQAAYHCAVGQATHLGLYEGEGIVRLDTLMPEVTPPTGEFSSAVPFVFVAANGDRLAFHYGREDFGAEMPGVVELLPAEDGKFYTRWIAEFNPVPEECTGRFEKVVDGSFIMIATTEAFVPGSSDVFYSWEGEGSLTFAKE